MRKILEIRNPNFEIRNKLEIRVPKYLNAQKARFSFSAVLIFHRLFRISVFEIRVSRRCAWFRLRRVGGVPFEPVFGAALLEHR
jgi:hypothetical protein